MRSFTSRPNPQGACTVRTRNFVAAIAALMACLSGTANADFTIDATALGRYQSSTPTAFSPGSVYAETGSFRILVRDETSVSLGSSESRNYFVFDLSQVVGQVTGVTFELENPGVFSTAGFDPVTSVNYRLRDASQDSASLPVDASANLGDAGYSDLLARFDDLGSGTLFGGATITAADDSTTLSFTLNSAAIASVMAHQGGLFAIGGAIDPPAFNNHLSRVDMFNNGVGMIRLIIQTSAVPEPGSLTLIGLGGIGALGLARRRRHRARSV